jgi:hypothetical protein
LAVLYGEHGSGKTFLASCLAQRLALIDPRTVLIRPTRQVEKRDDLILAAVLGALDFKVNARQDLLVARLDKVDEEQTARRLTDLGRLTLCVRQLDMLMSSDAVADAFARFFLEGEWHRF